MNDVANTETRYLRGELDFEAALREVTGTDIGRDMLVQILRGLHSPAAATPALSEHDAQVLEDAGFSADPATAAAARVDRDIRMAKLVTTSLSVTDAATRLGVTPARVRQRIGEGSLWAFDSGRHRLLPPAQFTATGGVPHLDKVMPQVPKLLHPLTLETLLTRPQESLLVGGRPVSIVAWLAGSAGTAGDMELVLDVITAADWESA